jgi:hypothetical protein
MTSKELKSVVLQDKIHNAAVSSLTKVQEYYDKTNELYIVVTLLDPRFKLKYFENDKSADKMNTSDVLKL